MAHNTVTTNIGGDGSSNSNTLTLPAKRALTLVLRDGLSIVKRTPTAQPHNHTIHPPLTLVYDDADDDGSIAEHLVVSATLF